MSNLNHTKGTWGIHKFSVGNKPFIVDAGDECAPWIACSFRISAGSRVIGELTMSTLPPISAEISNVDNMQELNANIERICGLVNVCDGLTLDEVRDAVYAVRLAKEL